MINAVYIIEYLHIQHSNLLTNSFYVQCQDYREIDATNNVLFKHPYYEGVVLTVTEPLCFVPFSETWQNKDIILHVNSIGSLRIILEQIELLKTLRLRLCFNSAIGSDVVKILSSAGIWCCMKLDDKYVDWSIMSTIADYALSQYPLENRIEPFAYFVSRYMPERGAVVPKAGFERFDVAFEVDFVEGEFSTTKISICNISTNDFIQNMSTSPEWLWTDVYNQQFFSINDDACKACPAFRICRSSIASDCQKPENCSHFFSNLMEQIEVKQRAHSN